MKKERFIVLFVIFLGFLSHFARGESIKERFQGRDALVYDVSFNGVPVGGVTWRYLGQDMVSGEPADVIYIDSRADILNLLNLKTKEKVFIAGNGYLPLKVERDVVLWGKKELIEEIYDQDHGRVKIVNYNSEKKEEVLVQDKPIHNILALLYFFPKNIELTPGKMFIFNLPTQKVKIKIVSERKLKINGKEKESYFLLGSGAKRFNLWLDKETRLPLRLEFITALGKVVILCAG